MWRKSAAISLAVSVLALTGCSPPGNNIFNKSSQPAVVATLVQVSLNCLKVTK